MTFAFVDVVDSTKTFAEHGEAFVAALAVLQERVARHTQEAGGEVVKTEGDGAFLAFPTAASAIDALVGLQDELALVPLKEVPRLGVRAGAHTGEAVPVADDYVALAVNVAARVTSVAGAGQLVVSAATQAELAAPVGFCVGEYDLRDVADPVELWRVCGDEAPLRGSPSRRTNVRIPVSGFVGRVQELAALRELVGGHRLVTVLGPGGLGKTRLVTELVLESASGIEGGAWLVELASLSTADQVPVAVGRALGIQSGEVDVIAAELRRRGEVWLVLDNCEHLIEAVAELVADLHEVCPQVQLVCTSREALQVPDERVWRLGPFVGPAARIELFTQRAWASGAVVPDDSVEMVDRLCSALDGLPLAIELAATQAGSTSLEELVRIAVHGSDDLARRGGQPRQRSLDAVLAWSLDSLSAPLRASLLVLSIVPGRFDAEMATEILGAVDACETDAVRRLSKASLVDLDGEDYRILDTIRHAARRHLVADPELASAARLALRAWAQRTAADVYRVRERHDMPIDRVLALETALEHAMDDGAAGVGQLWKLVEIINMDRDPSPRVVGLARRVLSGPLPADPDQTLCFAGALHILELVGPLPASDDRLEAICAAADRDGISYPAANVHFRLVLHYIGRGDLDAANRHVDAHVRYSESPGADHLDKRYESDLRMFVAYAAGDFAAMLTHAERALADARLRVNDLDLNLCEGNVAEALVNLGRPEEALPHAVEAVRLTPRPGPARRFVLLQLARAQSQLGDTAAALATARDIEVDLLGSGRSHEQIQAELEQLRREIPAAR